MIRPPITGYKNLKYPKGQVSQWFGENRALYFARMGMDGHNGIDVVAPWGTPIYAVEGGIVAEVKNSPEGFGKHIRILTDPIDGKGREWTYGHASENLVKLGDRVEAGSLVQKMGNTGFVVSGATPFWEYNPYAGTHLHLGLREYVVADYKTGWRYTYQGSPFINILNYGNGFNGAIDFRHMLDIGEDEEVIKGLQLTIISLLNQIIAILSRK